MEMIGDHEDNKCFIKYIDVQGYYDLVVLAGLVLLSVPLLWQTYKNSTSLRKKLVVEGLSNEC